MLLVFLKALPSKAFKNTNNTFETLLNSASFKVVLFRLAKVEFATFPKLQQKS
jgi:hypothetical protein